MLIKTKLNYLSYQNILFALFIVSGAIKFLFIYVNFPIDITLVIFGLILIDTMKNFEVGIKRLKGKGLFFIGVFLFLILLSIVTVFYSPSAKYKYLKIVSLFISLIGFTYPLFIKVFSLRLFFKTLLVAIVPSTLIFLIAKQVYWYGANYGIPYEIRVKASQIKGSYLALADYLAMSSLFMIYRKKYLYALGLILLIFALGAKGSLVFTICIILFWKRRRILEFKLPKKYVKRIIHIMLIGLISLVIFSDKIFAVFKIGVHRFSEFFKPTIEEGPEVLSRYELFNFAVEGILESTSSFIFGHGIGSFGILFKNEDEILYPHNIFLEAWFELGLLGLLTVSIFLLFPFFLKVNKMLFKLCAFYVFLTYLKTGSLDGARVLFLTYGCLIFLNEKYLK